MSLRDSGHKRWVAGIVVLIVAAILAFTVSFVVGNDKQGSGVSVGYAPTSPASRVRAAGDLQDLVGKADVIVIGTIGSAVNETDIGSYNVKAEPEAGPKLPTMPVTDYQVTVTTVLKNGDGVSPGDTVILREFGHLSKQQANPRYFENSPMSKPGDSGLFVLGMNPDGASYGLQFGRYSRFDIDGETVAYSDLEGLVVRFASGVSPSQFLASIRQEVQRQETQ